MTGSSDPHVVLKQAELEALPDWRELVTAELAEPAVLIGEDELHEVRFWKGGLDHHALEPTRWRNPFKASNVAVMEATSPS